MEYKAGAYVPTCWHLLSREICDEARQTACSRAAEFVFTQESISVFAASTRGKMCRVCTQLMNNLYSIVPRHTTTGGKQTTAPFSSPSTRTNDFHQNAEPPLR